MMTATARLRPSNPTARTPITKTTNTVNTTMTLVASTPRPASTSNKAMLTTMNRASLAKFDAVLLVH